MESDKRRSSWVVWLVGGGVLLSVALSPWAGAYVLFGGVNFHDYNFDVFGPESPLSEPLRKELMASFRGLQQAPFLLMVAANVSLLFVSGILFFKGRR